MYINIKKNKIYKKKYENTKYELCNLNMLLNKKMGKCLVFGFERSLAFLVYFVSLIDFLNMIFGFCVFFCIYEVAKKCDVLKKMSQKCDKTFRKPPPKTSKNLSRQIHGALSYGARVVTPHHEVVPL